MRGTPWLALSAAVGAVALAGCGGSDDASSKSGSGSSAAAKSSVPAWFTQPFAAVQTIGGKTSKTTMQLAGEKAAKRWKLCVSLPNGSDPYWVAVNYGLVTQAARRGVSIQVLDAGGYDKLSTQVSQLENCKNSGANAVIVAAISSEGIAAPVRALAASKIPVIADGNPVSGLPVVTQTAPPLSQQGHAVGEWVVNDAKSIDGEAQVAYFPGPPGTDWVELQKKGFQDAIAGSNVKIVATKYGETNPATQLSLVENTLKAYPDIKYIAGNGVAADVATNAIAQAGKAGKVKIASVYQSESLFDKVKSGSVSAMSDDQIGLSSALSVDLAIQALEGKKIPYENVASDARVLTKQNLPPRAEVAGLAPVGYKPQFSAG